MTSKPPFSSILATTVGLSAAVFGILCVTLFIEGPHAGAKRPGPAPDLPVIDKLVGPDKCGECHRAEYESWRVSHHQEGYKGMHRTPEAKAIAKSLGIKRIKSDPSCVRCHYTPEMKRGKMRAVHGVTCESCHGEAHDWLAVHDDFGGKEVARDQETPEHKALREKQCRERGMRTPTDVYALAAECFACHVVSDENLINNSAHPVGDQFEFLAWTQGEVRHNFLASNGKTNATPAMKRKRLFYVVGALLEAEYGLRALAVATTDGKYRTATQKRIDNALTRITAIDAKLEGHPFVGFVAGLREKPLAERDADSLQSFAEFAQRLARSVQELDLPKELDELLPATESYRGKSLAGQ